MQKKHQALLHILDSAKMDFPLLQEMKELVLHDAKEGQYQLLRFGWNEKHRIFDVLMHFELRPDGKIWVQRNLTEVSVEDELLKKGIATEDIVLGTEYPAYRKFSGFALA